MARKVLDQANKAGTISEELNGAFIDKMSAQLVVRGQGTVSATVVLEGSNTGQHWQQIAVMTATGDSEATDGGPCEALWERIRARVEELSGTDAVVDCYLETRGPVYGT